MVNFFYAHPNVTIVEAAATLGYGRDCIRRVWRKSGCNYRRDRINAETRQRETECEHWRAVLAKLHSEAYEGLYIDPVIKTRFPCKMLFSPDSHGNYWDSAVTEEMLKRDGDASLIVTNEILTLDAFSKFRQDYTTDTFGEFLVTEAFIDMLKHGEAEKERQVVISNSNHQERFTKLVADVAKTPDAIKAAGKLFAAGLEVFARIKPELVSTFTVQVGRAVFGHPDSYGATQGFVAARYLNRCNARYPEMGLQPPFQFLAVGHPHRLNLTQATGTRSFVAEAGCQCHVPRYAITDNTARPCTTFPMVNGYVSVLFDKLGNVERFGVNFVKFATMPGRTA